jgi:hypothetical protein
MIITIVNHATFMEKRGIKPSHLPCFTPHMTTPLERKSRMEDFMALSD